MAYLCPSEDMVVCPIRKSYFPITFSPVTYNESSQDQQKS